jgi:phage terminase large subunit-like protein
VQDVDIITAIKSPKLFHDTLSEAQETVLRAIYSLPLSDSQLEIYLRATGRPSYERKEYRECTLICGRRSGKSSRIAANVAVYEACFRKHKLAAGEKGFVQVLAATKRQAAIVYSYVLARLEDSPTLRRMLAADPKIEEVELVNNITIAVSPASYRSIRGASIVACVADELAFWSDDISAANPAAEVLRAIRPGMTSFPNAKLLKISSPFAKSGVIFEDWRDREKNPHMLVWKLGTREMNPSLSAEFLDEEQKRDPESYEREYNAQFYESASAFLPADAIENCVVRGRSELPYVEGVQYVAGLDAGFRPDAFSCTLVHSNGEKVIQDVIRSWRGKPSTPVSLARVLAEIVEYLNRYGIRKIYGDSFCSEPIRQSLKAQGVEFVQTTTLGARAAPIWSTLRTLITGSRAELLDDPETIQELKRLELVVTSGGNSRVEASSGHDGRAVVLALASHQSVAMPVRRPWVEVITAGPSHDDKGWTRIN